MSADRGAVVAILFCTAACSSGGMAVEDPAEHACEEREEDATSILPTAAPATDTPVVSVGAEPYQVELTGGTAFLRIVNEEEDADFIAFFGSADVLTNLYSETTTVPAGEDVLSYDDDGTTKYLIDENLESAGANEFCETDIPEHFDVELIGEGNFFLELVGTGAQWMLLSSAEGHTDE